MTRHCMNGFIQTNQHVGANLRETNKNTMTRPSDW